MPEPSASLVYVTRQDCHLCEEGRLELQRVLEERVVAGRPVLPVRYVDVDTDPALRARYSDLVPVLRLDDAELPLAMRPGAIRRFLAARLDARVA